MQAELHRRTLTLRLLVPVTIPLVNSSNYLQTIRVVMGFGKARCGPNHSSLRPHAPGPDPPAGETAGIGDAVLCRSHHRHAVLVEGNPQNESGPWTYEVLRSSCLPPMSGSVVVGRRMTVMSGGGSSAPTEFVGELFRDATLKSGYEAAHSRHESPGLDYRGDHMTRGGSCPFLMSNIRPRLSEDGFRVTIWDENGRSPN